LILATTVTRRLASFDDDNNGSTLTNRTIEMCTFSLPRRHYVVYYVADLVLFYVTPLAVACILYALIGRTLLGRRVGQASSGSTPTRRVDGNLPVLSSVRLTTYGSAMGPESPETTSPPPLRHNSVVVVVRANNCRRLKETAATGTATRLHCSSGVSNSNSSSSSSHSDGNGGLQVKTISGCVPF
jgi:hypothetical protein